MPDLSQQSTTVAVDTQLGGDAYMPGAANPITAAEITDIYANDARPVAERQAALKSLRREMVGRGNADLRNDTDALIAKIDEGLSYLSEPSEGFAAPDVLTLKD